MESFIVGFVCSCTQYTVLCRQIGLTSLVYFPFVIHNGGNNSTSPVLFTEPSCQLICSHYWYKPQVHFIGTINAHHIYISKCRYIYEKLNIPVLSIWEK